jgi:hypothetical protein
MENDSAIVKIYRLMFVLGGLIAFISCFIEWYHVEILNEMGQAVLECSYNLFTGWSVVDRIYSGALSEFYPKSSPIANEFLFFYLGIVVISVYIALFKGSPKLQNPQKSKYTAYFLLTSIIMMLVIILYFSFSIFSEEDMHIPALMINDQSYEVVIYQSIGIGFVLHIMSFIFLFPLAWVQFRMNAQFELINEDQKVRSEFMIDLNLDQLIAEEIARSDSKKAFQSTEIEKDLNYIVSEYQLRRSKQ